jgi:hypothetical protein
VYKNKTVGIKTKWVYSIRPMFVLLIHNGELMKKFLLLLSLAATPAMSQTILEMNRDEPMPKKADVQAGSRVIVDIANRNRDVVGAVVGGVIGGGFNARSIAGAAIGAYMSRPSGGGHGGSNP